MLTTHFKNKKIALVGPSPHLLGKNHGKFIDTFDLIIRINEHGVVQEMEKDYGSRTDIAFKTLSQEVV